VVDEITRQWQERQLFTEVAVTPTGCLGPCGMGPSVLVYPDGVMYGRVTVADVNEIFESHLIGGKPVQRLIMPTNIW
jgi:(2Fe-2S) ferredoxin